MSLYIDPPNVSLLNNIINVKYPCDQFYQQFQLLSIINEGGSSYIISILSNFDN